MNSISWAFFTYYRTLGLAIQLIDIIIYIYYHDMKHLVEWQCYERISCPIEWLFNKLVVKCSY